MNKFLRLVSTFVVGVGLILLFVYLSFQGSVSKAALLSRPSYYTLQNYWYLLAAGCGCVAFSILSSFLAWNRKLDEKVEVLPNAVGAGREEVSEWLTGSSLDTGKRGTKKTKKQPKTGTQKTEGPKTAPGSRRKVSAPAENTARTSRPDPYARPEKTGRTAAGEDTVLTSDDRTDREDTDDIWTLLDRALEDDRTQTDPGKGTTLRDTTYRGEE